jgi:membrane associated rhomboid family serine protease
MTSIHDGASCAAFEDESSLAPEGKSVPFSLLSSMFIHGGVEHLLGNMLFLWVFGRAVENRLGPALFLVLYLLAGVAAAVGYAVVHAGEAFPALGASGAIAGALGAYVVFEARSRILALIPGLITQLIYIPAFVVLGLYFVNQFVTAEDSGVAWEAHVGGMVAGALLALLLRRRAAPVSTGELVAF